MVAQSKNVAPARSVKGPVTPPIYRPQPTPQVLQRKAVTKQPVVGQDKRVAPAVYRPQPVPAVLQRKQLTTNPTPDSKNRTSIVRPGVVQRKATIHSQVIQRAAAAAGFAKRPTWDQYPTATRQWLIAKQAATAADIDLRGMVVCRHCRKVVHYTTAHIDHYPIPWRRLLETYGGAVPEDAAFDRGNLQLLCSRCNSSDAHNREMKDDEGQAMVTTRGGLKRSVDESMAKKMKGLGEDGGGYESE